MICKKCGYDYPAKELKCPYCGEVNPLGEKWKNEENLALKGDAAYESQGDSLHAAVCCR